MTKLKALVNTISVSVTATLLTAIEALLSYFPGLSREDYTPKPQEIEPDFYR